MTGNSATCSACGTGQLATRAARIRGTCGICDLLATGEPPGGHSPAGWPLYSDGLGVNPSQIPEFLERNKKHGITGVSYDPKDGRAILADRGARKGLLRFQGMRDNAGGYGD